MKSVSIRSWIPALVALLFCAICAQKNLSAHGTEASVLAHEGDATREIEWAISPHFDEAKDFSANGLAPVRVNNKYGFINEKGEFVIPPRFDDAGDFVANSLATVKMKGKWGYIRAPAPYR
jgi:hypothetical protein